MSVPRAVKLAHRAKRRRIRHEKLVRSQRSRAQRQAAKQK